MWLHGAFLLPQQFKHMATCAMVRKSHTAEYFNSEQDNLPAKSSLEPCPPVPVSRHLRRPATAKGVPCNSSAGCRQNWPIETRCLLSSNASDIYAFSHTFHLPNDLYCVGWGVKLYSLTHFSHTIHVLPHSAAQLPDQLATCVQAHPVSRTTTRPLISAGWST